MIPKNRLWGEDHDYTLEEILTELAYFRGESYHTIHLCGAEDPDPNCIYGNFSIIANKV